MTNRVLTVTIGLPTNAQETVNFVCKDICLGRKQCGVRAMSEIADEQSRPTTRRDEEADKQAFAQVEKWMAMIRELDRERQGQAKLAG
jgi:hypothetical protein